ncbi:SLAM family member 7 isoform X1 [Balaenoptera musculus]|uniref:SLAM family member 7 isoform X1 n=1 Tax=Balaenoptera musculus TaxID=9771 RepID=A0A8B8YKC4_BALMU|nr:SLAM family member 7 isoform X1 [Balaenoptera musculus]
MLASPACFAFIFLLCQLTGPAASGVLKKLVGALGGSVTFPLNLSVDPIDSIIWVFNTTTLVTIQPKLADKKAVIIVTQHRNKERVNFPHEGYSLRLSKLKKNDSGVYRVEIHSSTLQDPLTQEYELRVYEHLSKPKVIIGLQNNKNGTCVTNLTCSMEQGGEDVTYSWKSLGQATNESHSGSILPISWRQEKRDMTFICMARNPISSNSSNPIFAWNLCEGAAGGLATSVILKLLLSLILLCFIALVLIIFIIRRERRKEFIEEKKGLNLHPETLNYSPAFEETSEYDIISYFNSTIPEENAVNTLCSTVKIPPKQVEKSHSLPTLPDTPRQFTHENVI